MLSHLTLPPEPPRGYSNEAWARHGLQQQKTGRPYGTFPGLIPLGSPRYRYLGSHSPRAPRASRARGIPTGLYPGRPQGLPAPGLPRGSPGRSSVGIPREAVPGAPEGVPKGRVPLRGPRRFRSAHAWVGFVRCNLATSRAPPLSLPFCVCCAVAPSPLTPLPPFPSLSPPPKKTQTHLQPPITRPKPEYLMNVLISQGRSCRLIGDCAVVAAVTVPFVAGVIY